MSRVVDLWIRKDKSRTARYGKGKRWQAIWTDGEGRELKTSHETQAAAKTWLKEQDVREGTGLIIDKAQGRMLVSEALERWEAGLLHLREGTRKDYADTIARDLLPEWGKRTLQSITRSDVQGWVNTMSTQHAPRTVDTYYGRFRTFMEWCAQERMIQRSPTDRINLPKGRLREHRYLTVEEYHVLLEEIPPQFRDALDLMVTTGIRPGELWELRAGDPILARRRLRVSRSVSHGHGPAVIGPTKNGKPRNVPLADWVADALAERIKGKARTQLLFTTERGTQVRASNFTRRVWVPAVERAGIAPGLRFYDLRHTAASWAVRSGASVKSVQLMLGHASAKITLDVYAGLFEDDLDDVADRVGGMLGRHRTATGDPGS